MSLVNTGSYMGDCGVKSTVFFYGEIKNRYFNDFLDMVYMNGKIIISILSHLLREFQDTYSSGWDPVVFISEEGNKKVK